MDGANTEHCSTDTKHTNPFYILVQVFVSSRKLVSSLLLITTNSNPYSPLRFCGTVNEVDNTLAVESIFSALRVFLLLLVKSWFPSPTLCGIGNTLFSFSWAPKKLIDSGGPEKQQTFCVVYNLIV